MKGHPPGRRMRAAAWLATVSAVLACGGPGVNPTEADARAALEAALAGWRAGKKPADMATAVPPINVMDSEWANGRRITEFQILREEPSEADKRFTVRLVQAAPAKDEEVLYIVLGAETKSVFRADDYERAMNMDNNPAPKKRNRR